MNEAIEAEEAEAEGRITPVPAVSNHYRAVIRQIRERPPLKCVASLL